MYRPGDADPALRYHLRRQAAAQAAREQGRREAEPAVREEYARQERERMLEDAMYPYSPDPMGPDGAPVWGMPFNHDSRVVFERDSPALDEPDPARLDLDPAPENGLLERDLLAGIGVLDRDNLTPGWLR